MFKLKSGIKKTLKSLDSPNLEKDGVCRLEEANLTRTTVDLIRLKIIVSEETSETQQYSNLIIFL
jgi:hypothetical protein